MSQVVPGGSIRTSDAQSLQSWCRLLCSWGRLFLSPHLDSTAASGQEGYAISVVHAQAAPTSYECGRRHKVDRWQVAGRDGTEESGDTSRRKARRVSGETVGRGERGGRSRKKQERLSMHRTGGVGQCSYQCKKPRRGVR